MKEIKSASIVFTVEEGNELLSIIDGWLKTVGLNGANTALYYYHKLKTPFQPKPEKAVASDSEGVEPNEETQKTN